MKNCSKNALDVSGWVPIMLSISSIHMPRPAFSTSRLSCLLAHMQASITNLNCRVSSLSSARGSLETPRPFLHEGGGEAHPGSSGN